MTPLPEVGRSEPPFGMQRMFTVAARARASIISKGSGSNTYGDSMRDAMDVLAVTATPAACWGGIFSSFVGGALGFGIVDVVVDFEATPVVPIVLEEAGSVGSVAATDATFGGVAPSEIVGGIWRKLYVTATRTTRADMPATNT